MKVKATSLMLVLALSSFSLATLAATSTTTQSSTSVSQTSLSAAQTQDGQIIEIIMTIDNNEINAANEALKVTANPNVKAFAQAMITEHGQNLKEAQALSQKINIAPIPFTISEDLQKAGQKGLAKLESVSPSKFDTTYIDAMVKGHQAGLKLIDTKLMPKASNPDLKTFLITTRAMVANHLQMAQTVQSQLSK